MNPCKWLRDALLILAIAWMFAACKMTSAPVMPSESSQKPPDSSIEFRRVGNAFGSSGFATVEMLHNGLPVLVEDRAVITADDIQFVGTGFDHSMRPTLQIRFKPTSADRILELTGKMVGKPLAMIAHGKVLSIATVQSPYSESMMMSGFSIVETRKLLESLTAEEADGSQ